MKKSPTTTGFCYYFAQNSINTRYIFLYFHKKYTMHSKMGINKVFQRRPCCKKINYKTFKKSELNLKKLGQQFQVFQNHNEVICPLPSFCRMSTASQLSSNETLHSILFRCAQPNRKPYPYDTEDNWREPTRHIMGADLPCLFTITLCAK